MTLGQRLRVVRLAMGYTSREWEEFTGIERTKWSRIESDLLPMNDDERKRLRELGIRVNRLAFTAGERYRRNLQRAIDGTYKRRAEIDEPLPEGAEVGESEA